VHSKLSTGTTLPFSSIASAIIHDEPWPLTIAGHWFPSSDFHLHFGVFVLLKLLKSFSSNKAL
jgi:hypothetical protein